MNTTSVDIDYETTRTHCTRVRYIRVCVSICTLWTAVGKRVSEQTSWRTDWIHSAWYLRHWQEHSSHGTPVQIILTVATCSSSPSWCLESTIIQRPTEFYASAQNLIMTQIIIPRHCNQQTKKRKVWSVKSVLVIQSKRRRMSGSADSKYSLYSVQRIAFAPM